MARTYGFDYKRKIHLEERLNFGLYKGTFMQENEQLLGCVDLAVAQTKMVEAIKMEEQMNDEQLDDLGIPDIPEPDDTATDQTVNDLFNSAVKYSFIGVGHAGSRLVQSFYDIGYRRVCVVNTAKQDLDEIKLPAENKLWLGAGGAAKTRRLGENYMKTRYEDVISMMRKCFGNEFDRIIVCCSAGGGTGSGGFETAIAAANDLVESLRIKKVGMQTRVGLLIALPTNAERDRMPNTWEAMKLVEKMMKAKVISPVIIADNERINSIFRTATLGDVWQKANKSIAGLFHLFNKISVASTKYTAFDPADYNMLIDMGFVTYGMMRIKSTDKEDLSEAMRKNVECNVLSGGFNLKGAKASACLFVGEENVLDNIQAGSIEHAYEQLGRVIGGGVVHRGIYSQKGQTLTAYTIVGGMEMPKDRLDEISRIAGKTDWDE